MDPIPDGKFSHDFSQWVLQTPNVWHVHNQKLPKPFNVGDVKKSKKERGNKKKQNDKETNDTKDLKS